ncbi:flagellar export chaperone FliS [Methylobacillus flagellatus]|uniref:flagellar export chaperone FliS n=1 Tax=Methylobacillus flagellatus TaxID=405 RepID=UPI0010F84064|nr:flagellar export chaperone FliS [Methylobacillus flagellatus]
MFGTQTLGVQAYAHIGLETGVAASNPHQLIVMLYDGALTACRSALARLQSQDLGQKSADLSKAIIIIENGLRQSLDKEAGGSLADSLDSLYGYMVDKLFRANLDNDRAAIEEVIALLADIRGAWLAIATPAMPASGLAAYAAPTTANAPFRA